ncbi:MAG: preprotein translocase subunit YajC [Pirellulales bacterium]|nr:preprotein translocase subunit YajC [Pirellulales bacterium]
MPFARSLNSLFLLAAEAEGAADAAGGAAVEQPPALFSPWVLVAIFLAFYFIMLRPKQREEQQRRSMLGELKENDRVVTIGGIHGVVTNVQRNSDQVTIRVDESTGAKLRVNLSAVSRVVVDDDKKDGKGA